MSEYAGDSKLYDIATACRNGLHQYCDGYTVEATPCFCECHIPVEEVQMALNQLTW